MEKIAGWQWYELNETGSTNDEAKKICSAIHAPCIVTARCQTAGRGRRGRNWISEEGNLFMSFSFPIQVSKLGHYVMMSGLAVYAVIRQFCPHADVKIKWPNDVLVAGAKISGILFERAEDEFWVMGIGINIVSHPSVSNAGYLTAGLNTLGANTDRMKVFKAFVMEWERLINLYNNGGLPQIRQTWLDNAYNLGKKIIVKQEKENMEGIFAGVDEMGSLLLQTPNGLRKVIAGDVFNKEEKNEKD